MAARRGGSGLAGVDSRSDAADRIHELQQENTELKKVRLQLQSTIRELERKVENIQHEISAGQPADVDRLIRDLRARNETLVRDNRRLTAENEDLRVKLAAKRPGSAKSTSRPLTARSESKMGGPEYPLSARDGDDMAELRHALNQAKQQMQETEAYARRTEVENQQLRQQLPARTGVLTTAPSAAAPAPARAYAQSEEQMHRLEQEVKDAQTKLFLMKNRYDRLQDQVNTERQLHARTTSEMDQQYSVIRAHQRELEDSRDEIRRLKSQLASREDTHDELQQLKEVNQTLEERLARLCASPFISQSVLSVEKGERLAELERNERVMKGQLAHLQKAVHEKQHTLEELAKQLSEAKQQNEALQAERQQLQLSAMEAARTAATLKDRVTLYAAAGEDANAGVPSEELERALTLVRRRLDAPSEVEFLKSTGNPADELIAVKRQCDELRIKYHEVQCELQRSDKMVKHLQAMYDAQKEEIADLTAQASSGNDTLRRKLRDTQALAEERRNRVVQLEAQVKSLLARKPQMSQIGSIAPGGAVSASTVPGETLLVTESFAAPRGSMSTAMVPAVQQSAFMDAPFAVDADLVQGDNILEVWVVEATLDPAVLGRFDSTAVLIDFYDFESQMSPFLTGSRPKYNFAATYQVQIDAFMMRFLATDCATLEIHQSRGSRFEVLGRSNIRLGGLLAPGGRVSMDALPVVAENGAVIGHMRLKLRFAMPVADLFDNFLRARPAERAQLMDAVAAATGNAQADGRKSAVGGAATPSVAPAQATLNIKVVNCSGLPTSSGAPPLPCVRFQFLQYPAVSTDSPSTRTTNPTFEHVEQYVVCPTTALLSAMRSGTITFSVHDTSSSAMPVLGSAVVALADVAEGFSVSADYDLISPFGQPAGAITIQMSWAAPLVPVDTLAPDTLTLPQFNAIAAAYGTDGAGVAHVPLVRCLMMPPGSYEALCAVQQACAAADLSARKQGKRGSWERALEALAGTTRRPRGLVSAAEISGALSSAQVIVRPGDVVTAVQALAGPPSSGGEVMVPVADAIMALRKLPLDGQVGVQKLRKHLARVQAEGANVPSVIAARDKADNGRITSIALKAALSDLRVQWPTGGGADVQYSPRNEPDWGVRSRVAEGYAEEGVQDDGGVVVEARRIAQDARAEESAAQQSRLAQRLDAKRSAPGPESAGTASRDPFPSRGAASIEATPGASAAATTIQRHFKGHLVRAHGDASPERSAGSGATSTKQAAVEHLNLIEAEDAVRTAISYMTVEGKSPEASIRSLFAEFDANGDGVISAPEFQRALDRLGVAELAPGAAEVFVREFGWDAGVNCSQFMEFALAKPRTVTTVWTILRDYFSVKSVDTVVRNFDLQRDGSLSRAAFVQGLQASRIALNPQQTAELLDAIDPNNSGTVQWDTFEEFVKELEPSAGDGTQVSGAEALLRRKLQEAEQKYNDTGKLKAAFARYDVNGDGVVSKAEFENVLQGLGIRLLPRQMYVLFKRFDRKDTGSVKYEDFLHFVHGDRRSTASAPSGGSAGPGRAASAVARTPAERLASLQKRCYSGFGAGAALDAVRQEFQRYDSRNLGMVYTYVLEAVVKKAGVPFSDKDLEVLRTKFDPKNNNTIKWKEFLTWITSAPAVAGPAAAAPGPAAGAKAASDGKADSGKSAETGASRSAPPVVQKVREIVLRVEASGLSIRQVFEHFDPEDRGSVTNEDFGRALEQIDVQLTPEELQVLVSYLDTDRSGTVEYSEFEAFVLQRAPPPAAGSTDGSKEAAQEKEKLRRRIRQMIRTRKMDVSAMFARFASAGSITVESLIRGADELGCSLSEPVARRILRDMSKGKVGLNEFATFVNDADYGRFEAYLRRKILMCAAKGNRVAARELAQAADTDGSGLLSERAFNKLVDDLNLGCTTQEKSRIAARYDGGSGRVAYRDLCKFVEEVLESYERMSDILGRVARRLRDLSGSDSKSAGGTSPAAAAFQKLDTGNYRSLDYDTFERGLRELGLKLTAAELTKLTDGLDFDRDGRIGYNEFVELVEVQTVATKTATESKAEVAQAALKAEVLTNGDRGLAAEDRISIGISGLTNLAEKYRTLSKLKVSFSFLDEEQQQCIGEVRSASLKADFSGRFTYVMTAGSPGVALFRNIADKLKRNEPVEIKFNVSNAATGKPLGDAVFGVGELLETGDVPMKPIPVTSEAGKVGTLVVDVKGSDCLRRLLYSRDA